MIISAQIISIYPPSRRLYVAYSCNVLRFILQDDSALSSRYPTCTPVVDGTNMLGEALQVAVQANFKGGSEGRTEELSAALRACFPMAAWLAWALHIIGTEVYLKLTPAEAERLRQISYIRQVGFSPRSYDTLCETVADWVTGREGLEESWKCWSDGREAR